ncbi:MULTISPECIES: hypothetical protein [Anoxybacillus]|uniref:Uncharacterized protein n=1 Tax=Anoxybacillus flavithermus TaxID=33934 RepID=A0AAX2A145_9BACL|nr:hypothetical protein [Anoxybacillus flavithermus]ASA95786.1 hypothetical protein CA592_02335 [Anoxybacillus flavithermus]ELK22131.1 hypothetical protein AF6_1203 [Anoxybacillus flavithermus TNO-09.006]MBE2906267.1 hypothetical protein [Anoxybacillus flavithermus]MBE2908875.1 hypothetical protein [Anoxybacillus flavithermus]MBE2911611.1 hypothetical protein [Anoxybacillus flavithermus]
MDFVRVIKHSNDLEKFIDIPEGLKNRKVEIIILPYTDQEDIEQGKKKSLRGALSKYKNEVLQNQESDAWSKNVVDQYENR